MARIRAIKPQFFRNEQLAEFSFAHRLLFAGLWTQADKEGRLEDRPKRLKAELFPYDDGIDISAMVQDLARGKDPLIVRYVVDGIGFIWIRKFAEHQRPHHTEPESRYPPPPQYVAPPPDLSGGEPTSHASETLRVGVGVKEGNGVGVGESQALAPLAPRRVAPADLAELWNSNRGPLPKCVELTDKRKRQALQRIRERPNLEDWRQIIRRIAASRFCRGENDRGWRASFDWMLQPDTPAKVLEGKYDSFSRLHASGSRTGDSTDAARQFLEGRQDEWAEEGVIDASRGDEG